MSVDRSPELHDRQRSRVVMVDVQDKLVAAMPRGDELVANVRWLAEAAKLCGVPVHATEQYPQGLGATVSSLQEYAAQRPPKVRFSAKESLGWTTALSDPDGRDQVILAGVEAHVCVLQTAFDLMAAGYRVTIAADAISSRREFDQQIAITRLRDAGATIATIESIAFEWLETAAAPEFRAVSALAKSRPVG
jgi:nicotinamidase-related amidase